jgi:hypothetical protein
MHLLHDIIAAPCPHFAIPPPKKKSYVNGWKLKEKVLEPYPELFADIKFCEPGQFFQ